MRISILSNNSTSYSTTRLRNAARARGHTVRVMSTSSFSLDIKTGKPGILYKGKPITSIDAVIPRIAASQSFYGTAVVRQFEQMGIYCLNPSFAISVSRDKLRSMQILSRHKIGIPDSGFAFGKSDIDPALERIGGAPAVIKLLEGTHGAGVMLAETAGVARAIIEALQVAKHNVLIQKFIAESKGRDIRAFVVGDRVVAAMKRIAREGEFRSNVHLGADTEPIELDEEYARVAVRAAHIMGLRVAGVDILESATGPQILEINSSPGLEGIEGATHIDIADAVIAHLEEQIKFPDVDIRERLTLSKGYSVVELPIIPKSTLCGKSIAETTLGEQEIQILSITRDSVTIPTPSSSEVIKTGDVLLCFGKQLTLKALMPEREKRRKVKPKTISQEQIQEALDATDHTLSHNPESP